LQNVKLRRKKLNTHIAHSGISPFDDPIDRILAEVALSIQLPPSLHDKAAGRYEAVRSFLESTTAFNGQIEFFYPQGSMAIDATISNRGTDDEYDLDVVSQFGGRFRALAPFQILQELEEAIKDYPVRQIKRQTRCVTLFYSDDMHLDITPSLLEHGKPERESLITHAKGPGRSPDDCFVGMNAFGFVDWFRQRTPIELRMANEFNKRWRGVDQHSIRADAEVDEVPDQTKFVVKNTATLALQLIKRFRNIQYAKYAGRIPPSVMLSCYAGMAAQPNSSLTAMIVRIANWIISDIESASLYGRKLHVANPVCPNDVFTDRWPESIDQQNEFIVQLKSLVSGIETLRRGTMFPDQMMDWLRNQFGDRVVTKAAENMARDVGNGIQQSDQLYSRKGTIVFPKPAIISGAASMPFLNPGVVAAKNHTFFGKKI
jgi:hypothetical protein